MTTKEHPSAPSSDTREILRKQRMLDGLSVGAFVLAPVLGACAIASNIHRSFYDSFVLGYKQSDTPFTPIVTEFTSKDPVKKGKFAKEGNFAYNLQEYEAGRLKPQEYINANKKTAITFRGTIAKELEKFGIPTGGWKGWGPGTVRRFEAMGSTARKSSLLGFGTLGAVGVGAVAVLRNNKHTVDKIDSELRDKLTQIEQHEESRGR